MSKFRNLPLETSIVSYDDSDPDPDKGMWTQLKTTWMLLLEI